MSPISKAHHGALTRATRQFLDDLPEGWRPTMDGFLVEGDVAIFGVAAYDAIPITVYVRVGRTATYSVAGRRTDAWATAIAWAKAPVVEVDLDASAHHIDDGSPGSQAVVDHAVWEHWLETETELLARQSQGEQLSTRELAVLRHVANLRRRRGEAS